MRNLPRQQLRPIHVISAHRCQLEIADTICIQSVPSFPICQEPLLDLKEKQHSCKHSKYISKQVVTLEVQLYLIEIDDLLLWSPTIFETIAIRVSGQTCQSTMLRAELFDLRQAAKKKFVRARLQ